MARESWDNDMAHMIPERVEASFPMQLFADVMEKVSKGYDICGPMFASSDYSKLNIYMVKMFCLYEYYLIQADSLEELDLKVGRLTGLGYDFLYGVMNYRGSYLQWMARMFEKTNSDHLLTVNSEQLAVGEGLTMVEDVRPLGRLAPAVSFDSAVEYVREVGS